MSLNDLSSSSVKPHASLARAGSLSALFVMCGAGLAFAASLIVSNGVGAEGSGQFFSIVALFAIATSTSVFGADTGLVRAVSAQRELADGTSTRQLFGYALGPVLLVSALIAAGTLLTGLWWPGFSVETRAAVCTAAPFVILSAVMTLCFGVLRGRHRVIEFAGLQNLLLPSLRVVTLLVAVLMGGGLGLLAGAWSAPVLIVLGITVTWVLPELRKDTADLPMLPSRPHGSASAAPEGSRSHFWAFSSARGFAALVETLLEWIDVLLIGVFLGPASAGVYGAVNRCVRVGVMVEHTARIVTGPSISSALTVGDLLRARRIFVTTTRLMLLLAWPFYITLAVYGTVILDVFGPAFSTGADVLWIICPAMMLAASAGGVQSVLLMSGRSRWQLLNKCAALLTAATLCVVMIPHWGLAGAGLAWACAVMIDCGLAAYQVHTQVGLCPQAGEVIPAALLVLCIIGGGALLTLVVFGPSMSGLLLHLTLSGGLYALLLVRFRRGLGLKRLRGRSRREGRTDD